MIETILHILFLIIFIYLSVNTLYLFIAALAARFYSAEKLAPSIHKKNFAILIPSYNEDEVILNTATTAVNHDYPNEHFDVFIAAHHLSEKTLESLSQLNAHIYPVNFERGSKARSLNYLLNSIDETKYDVALILDGDNIIMPGVLEKINAAFQKGAACVQVHRTAKNKNTALATLDALSEEINNSLFRRGQRALGFSAALIGSGMAFQFKKLKEIYNKPGILDNPACDREVDFEILKSGIKVEYIDEIYVLDEKVSKNKIFEDQRRRWMESQLLHLKLFFTEKVNHKTKDYWNKLFINLIPPRILLVFVFFILFLVCLLQWMMNMNITGISLWYWGALFMVYIITMLISVPGNFYQIKTLKAILHIPATIIVYLKAAAGIKPRRTEFIHTPKSFTDKSDM